MGYMGESRRVEKNAKHHKRSIVIDDIFYVKYN